MHHDSDDQRGPNQHNSQHWETGDGGQFPHVRRVLRFTCWLHKKNSKAPCDWQNVACLHFRCQVSYMCCRRGSWDTACMMHMARRHPHPCSRTPICRTDLHTEKRQGSHQHLWQFNFLSQSLGNSESKLGTGGFEDIFLFIEHWSIIEGMFKDWCSCCRNQP